MLYLLSGYRVQEAPHLQTTKAEIIANDIPDFADQPKEVVEALVQTLNVFRDAIAMHDGEIGCTNILEMDIREKPNSRPVMKKPYKVSDDERERVSRKSCSSGRKMKDEIATESSYASPVLLIKKKYGDDRLVIDFRALNKQTERIHFPLPTIDECQTKIGMSKCFAILDLAHGYLQLPLKAEARAKTEFVTPTKQPSVHGSCK